MKKLLAISFIPGAAMALLFLFFGDYFEESLKPDAFNKSFDFGSAWIVAIGLMVSDLFLPIPASAIMSAIGSKYGMLMGFIINFTGLLLSGITAYFTARALSKKYLRLICTEKEIQEYGHFFNRFGGTSIILSRALPILPEVTSIMAGFVKMNLRLYLGSLTLGSAGVALLFTWLGHSSAQEPIWGIATSVCIPLVLSPTAVPE